MSTVVLGMRLPARDAELFKQQAERHGLTTSGALTALVKTSQGVGAGAKSSAADSDPWVRPSRFV